jgi:hypothetical protein
MERYVIIDVLSRHNSFDGIKCHSWSGYYKGPLRLGNQLAEDFPIRNRLQVFEECETLRLVADRTAKITLDCPDN